MCFESQGVHVAPQGFAHPRPSLAQGSPAFSLQAQDGKRRELVPDAEGREPAPAAHRPRAALLGPRA